MGMYVQQVPVKFLTGEVSAGETHVIDMMSMPVPATVSVIPGTDGSMLVEFSTTPYAAGDPDSATWFEWDSGTVTANTNDYLHSPVAALRITAATSAGVWELNA